MSMFDKVLEELAKDDRLFDMPKKEIIKLYNDRVADRVQELNAIQIEGIPESFYSIFAKYCVDHGFDEDEYIELLTFKFSPAFHAEQTRQGVE